METIDAAEEVNDSADILDFDDAEAVEDDLGEIEDAPLDFSEEDNLSKAKDIGNKADHGNGDIDNSENINSTEQDEQTDFMDSTKNMDLSNANDNETNVDNSEQFGNNNFKDSDLSDTPKPYDSVSDYMNDHNYGADDFATYSQDPVWRDLQQSENPDYELPPLTQENAKKQLSDYMNAHNYGADDLSTYSQDPKWRELQSAAFPDYELPPVNENLNKDYNDFDDAKDIYDNDVLDQEYDALSKQGSKDLTEYERDSLERYSGSDYSGINKTLYSDNYDPGSTYKREQIQNDINNITNSIKRSEIPYDSRVYRGIDNIEVLFGDDAKNMSIQELNGKYSGSYFINKGFTSTSTSYSVAQDFSGTFNGGVMSIDVPRGSNGIAMGNVSLFKDGEKEILFQRGSVFRINSIVIDENNKLKVLTKLLGNKEG